MFKCRQTPKLLLRYVIYQTGQTSSLHHDFICGNPRS